MVLKILQIFLLFLLPVSSIACCSQGFMPNLANIVGEKIEYRDEVKGHVAFVGIQLQSTLLWYIQMKPQQERNILSLFISKLGKDLRRKINITRSSDLYGSMLIGWPYNWRRGEHEQLLFQYHHPVSDEPSSSGCMFYSNLYKDGNNRMERIGLSQIKKYSNADYFLVVAINLLEFERPLFPKPNQKYKLAVDFLVIAYSYDGKKVYSESYQESIDVEFPILGELFPPYDCIVQLLENQGEQISKDLSFLLTANDAPSPTLEDLHRRLQQPGTIDDDVKFLKEFRKK